MSRPSAAEDREAVAADRRRLVGLAVVSLLAASALVIAGWQLAVLRGGADRSAQRDEVRAAAPAILAGVFSYDPKTVAADSRRARALVTDEFAAANAAALSERRAGAASWQTRTLGIEDSGDDWVQAVAVVSVTDPDQAETSVDRIVAARFRHQRSRWRLDSVEMIR
ncbi:hypothetical protein GCM10010528_05300 [Gordonia defluvii]|jgi:hypothetical protein|uniref:Mce-associated membrane protein n=1 Tax=Gordonia defluvii TaxID=283718 RepID=A0ABN3YFE8_9ACTN